MRPLATLADVAAKAGLKEDPSNLRLVNALDYASGIVRTYTGQVFSIVEDDVTYISGSGTDALQLLQLPVLDTPAVVEYDATGAEVTQPTTYLVRLHPAGILYRIDAPWCIGALNFKVTYSHGYVFPGEDYQGALSPSPLPGIVRATTASIAASLYALDPLGTVSSEAIGNYSVSYQAASAEVSTWEYALTPLAHFRVVDAA